MKKMAIGLALSFLIVFSIPFIAALEKFLIVVAAQIDSLLTINPQEIDFGNFFAQEIHERNLNVSLSNSFIANSSTSDLIYSICLVKDETGEDLTQLLNLTATDENETDAFCPDISSLSKSENDLSDFWNLKLTLPHIFKFDSNDPLLCRDDVTDQSCDEPE